MHNNEVSNGNASMEDVFHSAEKRVYFYLTKGSNIWTVLTI